MKPLIPILVVLGVIATFAVDDPNTAMAKPTPSDLVMTSDGVENWNGKKIHYQLKGRENPNITFEKNREVCAIGMEIDGVKRHLLLKDDEIVVNGRKFDTGSYSELSLNASKDFLIVKIVKTWSQASSHSAENSSTNDLNSTSSRSSSSRKSSGKSLLALGFVDFAAGIEFRFEGGDSIENSIQIDSGKCVIEFDIDKGKNKRKIVIKPSLIEIDNDQRKIGDNPKIALSATKKRASLRIKVNGKEVWAINEGLTK